MNLGDITPVILTYNEAPNIGRCLEKLTWAKDIVVVDSFSTDETMTILSKYHQVRVYQRVFKSFADQCNYALQATGIRTDWVLSLDADYIITDSFIQEAGQFRMESNDIVGYEARFKYCVNGRILRGAFYPPVTVLFLCKFAKFVQDGHAHRVRLGGKVSRLQSYLYHDDRKPFKRWLASQKKYAREEAVKINSTCWKALNWRDKIRKPMLIAPVLIFFYGLLGKGLILDGWPGIYYCVQRMIAEGLLSIYLLKRIVKGRAFAKGINI